VVEGHVLVVVEVVDEGHVEVVVEGHVEGG